MTLVEKPTEAAQDIHFTLEPSCISGNDVLKSRAPDQTL